MREAGYYWIKYDDEWVIAKWLDYPDRISVESRMWVFEGTYIDDKENVTEIDERKIVR